VPHAEIVVEVSGQPKFASSGAVHDSLLTEVVYFVKRRAVFVLVVSLARYSALDVIEIPFEMEPLAIFCVGQDAECFVRIVKSVPSRRWFRAYCR